MKADETILCEISKSLHFKFYFYFYCKEAPVQITKEVKNHSAIFNMLTHCQALS